MRSRWPSSPPWRRAPAGTDATSREGPLDHAKAALRAQLRARREALGADDAALAARSAADHLASDRAFAAAQRIAAYLPVAHELSTEPLLARVAGAGKALLLPRMDAARGVLVFVPYEVGAALQRGRYGVREPIGDAVSDLGPDDLVVVPGLAFDAQGRRLGSGGGWYDRTFALRHGAAAPILLGFAFHAQIVERVPEGPEDRRIDGFVTERGVWRVERVEGAGLSR